VAIITGIPDLESYWPGGRIWHSELERAAPACHSICHRNLLHFQRDLEAGDFLIGGQKITLK
jgi:hypothetical protein